MSLEDVVYELRRQTVFTKLSVAIDLYKSSTLKLQDVVEVIRHDVGAEDVKLKHEVNQFLLIVLKGKIRFE
jgi:hypothetical protein